MIYIYNNAATVVQLFESKVLGQLGLCNHCYNLPISQFQFSIFESRVSILSIESFILSLES